MRPHEIVDALRLYANATASAAERCLDREKRGTITMMASVLLSAADQILQLQDRLVRQACYFEHIEAVNEPRWPLLEDDDDAGAAL